MCPHDHDGVSVEPRRRAHIDGKNALERRAEIAAGAVTLGAADYQQTAAQVAHIFFDGLHLCVRQLKGRHVIEHQKIVSRELGERQRMRPGQRFDNRVALHLQYFGDHALTFRLRRE